MKRALKWSGIILGGLLAMILLLAAVLLFNANRKLAETYDVTPAAVAIPTDEAALARGEHLADVFCRDCHGENLTGAVLLDDPAMATIYAGNLTGLGDAPVEELVLALRHGLDADGTPLAVMPAESFIYFSAADLGAIIAYLQSLPPAGEPQPDPGYGPVGRLLLGAGPLEAVFPAMYVDHTIPFPPMPDVGATVAYGEYIARTCQGCHGGDLAGGQPPDPDAPAAPNLTRGGSLRGWTEADFLTAMRTGVKPSGALMGDAMPWRSLGQLDDDELRSLFMYLQSLDAPATATQ